MGDFLSSLRVVIKRNAHGAAVVAVVLADDLLAVQLPQARVVVAARRDEVGAVGAEGAVPDPALVALEGRLEGERLSRAGPAYEPPHTSAPAPASAHDDAVPPVACHEARGAELGGCCCRSL